MRGNPEVVDYLNMLIGGELAARDQYLIHSRMYEDWGFTELYERINHEMEEEAQHADALMEGGHEWQHAQELLLMREVMRLIGRSLAPGLVLREMLHLMSELLGLNRGRIVLVDDAPSSPAGAPRTASIQHAYGLTQAEVQRGRYAWGEGITGRVLATGQPAIVQDIDAEPLFLARAVERSQLPPETVAFIALPIEVNNAPIGVLACHRIRSRQRHLNDDLAVLRVLGELKASEWMGTDRLGQLAGVSWEHLSEMEALGLVVSRPVEGANKREWQLEHLVVPAAEQE